MIWRLQWLSNDFQMTFKQFSNDFQTIFKWLSNDFQMTFKRFSNDFQAVRGVAGTSVHLSCTAVAGSPKPRWYFGILVLWYFGILPLWYFGFMVLPFLLSFNWFNLSAVTFHFHFHFPFCQMHCMLFISSSIQWKREGVPRGEGGNMVISTLNRCIFIIFTIILFVIITTLFIINIIIIIINMVISTLNRSSSSISLICSVLCHFHYHPCFSLCPWYL